MAVRERIRINNRIKKLDQLLSIMVHIGDKIECRILQAEKMALEQMLLGTDLEKMLKWCVENEQFSGAEGIRKTLAWRKSLKENGKVTVTKLTLK